MCSCNAHGWNAKWSYVDIGILQKKKKTIDSFEASKKKEPTVLHRGTSIHKLTVWIMHCWCTFTPDIYVIDFFQANTRGKAKYRGEGRGIGISRREYRAHESSNTRSKLWAIIIPGQWSIDSQVAPFTAEGLSS